MSRRFSDLDQRRRELLLGGGAARIEKQHRQGKLTARERLALLLDPDSFVEFGLWAQEDSPSAESLAAEGVVTGKGWVDGRAVYAFSQDFTVAGGSVGKLHAAKICECLRGALRTGLPVVGFNDSGGARIQEGVEALSGYGQIFYTNTLLSGVVPQISVIAGPCAGGAAYSPALTDFIVMVEESAKMFIAGPDVIRAATGLARLNYNDLIEQIKQGILASEAEPIDAIPYGERFRVVITISGPKGTLRVRTGWIYRIGEDVPRLATLYPLP